MLILVYHGLLHHYAYFYEIDDLITARTLATCTKHIYTDNWLFRYACLHVMLGKCPIILYELGMLCLLLRWCKCEQQKIKIKFFFCCFGEKTVEKKNLNFFSAVRTCTIVFYTFHAVADIIKLSVNYGHFIYSFGVYLSRLIFDTIEKKPTISNTKECTMVTLLLLHIRNDDSVTWDFFVLNVMLILEINSSIVLGATFPSYKSPLLTAKTVLHAL